MHKLNFLARVMNYYKKKGSLSTLRRIYEQPYRMIFKNQRILIYAELNEVKDSVLALPPDIMIDRINTHDEAVRPDMHKMKDYWDKEKMTYKVMERFSNGAVLWIIKLNKDIAGFVWSISGKTVSRCYLPLTPHDAYILDALTFEEYRGRGLYPLLMNFVLGKLKSEGVSRIVGELYASNTSSIRGLEKTYYHMFGKARRFHLFGRNITIWSQ